MTLEAVYEELLNDVRGFFQPHVDKPDETAESVLRALWFHAAGRPKSISLIDGSDLPEIDAPGLQRLQSLIERKRSGIPLAHLTGRQGFMGLELLVGPAALVPRKETEIVGGAAIAYLRQRADEAKLIVLDVCTGSGNLALACAHHEPRAQVFASDISGEAVALAQQNAAFTGLAGRVEFRVGDLFAPFEADARLLGGCDLVTCNPPYITSAKVPKLCSEIEHEPRLAFDGGALGLSVLTRLFKEAPKFLKPGGALAFELGAGQGPVLEARLRRLPWVERVELHRDAEGQIRALLVTRR